MSTDRSVHGVGYNRLLTRMCFANGKAVSVVEPAVSEVHMTRLKFLSKFSEKKSNERTILV